MPVLILVLVSGLALLRSCSWEVKKKREKGRGRGTRDETGFADSLFFALHSLFLILGILLGPMPRLGCTLESTDDDREEGVYRKRAGERERERDGKNEGVISEGVKGREKMKKREEETGCQGRNNKKEARDYFM
jgi:hypothetical protein